MTLKRLDHVSVVVEDLEPAIAFFAALGLTVEAKMPIEGSWVDRINAIEGIRVDIVMMRTPDGHGRLELTKFHNPKLVEMQPAVAPPNALGLRSVMFTVESVDDAVARLRPHGGELIGEVVQYEDQYRLCYMRGPAGSLSRWPRSSGRTEVGADAARTHMLIMCPERPWAASLMTSLSVGCACTLRAISSKVSSFIAASVSSGSSSVTSGPIMCAPISSP